MNKTIYALSIFFMFVSTFVHAEDKYSGEMKNGVAHGQGAKYFSDGSTYIGYFENGEMSGNGTLTLKTGQTYSGYFKNNVFGAKKQGKIRYLDGTYEEGIFDDWKLNGEGVQSLENGEFRKGFFINGILNGKGEIRWPSGQNYVGEFVNGIFEGYGTYTELDEQYNKIFSEGEFKNGALNGKGKRVFPNTYEYEGEFKDNVFEGFGRLKYSDGVIINGEFKNGKLNGKASYEVPGKFVFVGMFVDNEVVENGTITEDKKDRLITLTGKLDHGQPKVDYPAEAVIVFKKTGRTFSGLIDKSYNLIEGKLHYGDDYEYVGKFKNNVPTTQGILKWKDLTYSGTYDKAFNPSGVGTITYKDNSIYEGEVSNFEPHGKGRFSFSDSEFIIGNFDKFNITNCSYTHPDKSMFVEFCNVDRVFNGKAAIFYRNNEFYIGSLQNSAEIGKSYVRKNYSASSYYVGYFEDGMPKGLGKLYDTNARFIEGEFNTLETIYKKKSFRIIYADDKHKVYYNKSGNKMIETLWIPVSTNPTESFSTEQYIRYQSKCDNSFLLVQQRKRNEQWIAIKKSLKPDSDLNKSLYHAMCK